MGSRGERPLTMGFAIGLGCEVWGFSLGFRDDSFG